MAKKEKYRHAANPERVRAENERRRSSAASPQESRDKRLRTDERIVANELRQYDRTKPASAGDTDQEAVSG